MESPDVPYVTVEFRDGKICQWYGYNDRKPDEEEVQAFLDSYIRHISKKKEKIRV